MPDLFIYFCQLVAVLVGLIVVPSVLGLIWAARVEKKRQEKLDQFWEEQR